MCSSLEMICICLSSCHKIRCAIYACRFYSRNEERRRWKEFSDSEIIARYIGESRHFIPEITPDESKARRIVNSRQRTILFYETLRRALENVP